MSPLAHNLRACLPELAERTREQLFHLHGDLTPERCELMVVALHEVATVCRRIGAELQRGEPPTV